MSSAARPRTTAWHAGLGARVMGAFGALTLLFALTLGVCLQAFMSVTEAERDVFRYERARHAADRSAILMRDQYIHQAHTLIALDDSHVAHYEEVARASADAVETLASEIVAAEDGPLVEELARHRDASDRTFREQTLPAIVGGDRAAAARLHERMEASVVAFSRVVEELHARNDARADAARQRVEAAWGAVRRVSIACLVAAALVTTALAWFLRRVVVARIRALTSGTERIGAGDLRSPIALGGADELGVLGREIDAMAVALAQREEQLVRTHRLVSMGRVAAAVAHELNNPLGVILGYAKLLRRRGELDVEALGVIEQEAEQASRIVASMLDLAKPQALTFADVDLAALARDCVERLRQIERLAGVVFVVRVDEPAVARADEARLRQVLVNVLTNAAEASLPQGRVDVIVRREGERAQLVIVDAGAGFADREAPYTEPFFTTKPDGVGLGLAIAQAILEAHDGALALGNAPGGGGQVEVTLPCVRALEAA